MSLVNFVLILLNTVILVAGQFLWKYGMMKTTFKLDPLSIIKILFSPFIFSGLVMYGFATILWLFILSRVPLSIAYPVQSIAYVLAVFGAYFVFHEPLSPTKIIGVILIILGVSLIGISPNTQ
ncbi:EamA family transporter [Parageobacillus sp. VR-IP]|uniref:EamA family transporter n=1 Tax=Parageobacillus sp. VR-IP TaxID=2742205 RepID=UPI0015815DB8|nr:EamA family transporter [Parageobacillus sp. VR-IP]NUK29791.1 EamA family transporter [Parageobacillus sp. VR-IP]